MSSAVTQHVRIQGGRPLRGRVRVPVDLPVAQRALLFAALGDGPSTLLAVPQAQSITDTLVAWRSLGVQCTHDADRLSIQGVGFSGLRMPSGALECGRSVCALALFAGVLSGQRFGTRITLHASLAAHSVEHIVGPLRARGAHIAGRSAAERVLSPVAVAPMIPPEQLTGLDCTLPWADPEAKSAALISGLFASSATMLSEPSVSADHTERMMVGLGLPLRRIGSVVSFDPSEWDHRIAPVAELALPGSPTLAAYLAVAAQLLPGSDITLLGVGVNPTRSGALEMLAQWSNALALTPQGDAALREPIADIRVRTASVRGGVVGGELLVRARDELPALAVLGAAAQRGVRLCDLSWLGAEPDPTWTRLDPLFSAFDLSCVQRTADEFQVGKRSVELSSLNRRVDGGDDPRLSLCACLLGLASPGETVVEHAAEALRAMYPGFVETARALGAEIDFV